MHTLARAAYHAFTYTLLLLQHVYNIHIYISAKEEKRVRCTESDTYTYTHTGKRIETRRRDARRRLLSGEYNIHTYRHTRAGERKRGYCCYITVPMMMHTRQYTCIYICLQYGAYIHIHTCVNGDWICVCICVSAVDWTTTTSYVSSVSIRLLSLSLSFPPSRSFRLSSRLSCTIPAYNGHSPTNIDEQLLHPGLLLLQPAAPLSSAHVVPLHITAHPCARPLYVYILPLCSSRK